MQNLGAETIELIHDGAYPIIEDVNVSGSAAVDADLMPTNS